MIWPAIRRIFAVAFAFAMAALTGAIALFFLGAKWAAGEATAFTPDEADDVSRMLNEGLGIIAFFLTVAPALTLLPALAAVAVAEAAKIRSILYYVIAGGAAAALMPLIAAITEAGTSPAYSGQYFAIIATAGFTGGFVYWLIAGRNA